jgi:hypothetical protein
MLLINNRIDMLYMKTCLRRVLLLIAFTLFIATNGFPKSRTRSEALNIVNSFCQKTQRTKVRSSSGIASIRKLAYSCTDSSATISSSENAYYYVFNVGENKGFVIVSGDDRAKDILGYSDTGSFSTDSMPENFKNWMAFYKSELKALAAIPEDTVTATSEVDSITTNTLRTASTTSFATSISPLLGSIKWDQSSPYNILCPKISSTQAPAGCVAIAMAQILKYYQWPVKGTGSKTYKSASVNKSLTVNFSKTTYDWTNMLNTYDDSTSTLIQDTAVATLVYHCGVAVSMDYDKESSSAYSNEIPAALSNYFGYDQNAQLYCRDYYTESEWLKLIKTELNANRPIIYGGSTTSGSGHQFICDGYDSDSLFHFNWGWNGYCDGYFELTSLNVETPGISGGTGGFTVGQDMVIGIQKPITTSVKNYQMFLTQVPEVNATTISRDSTFTVAFGLANYGGNTFDGYYALGLYQGDSLVSILKKYSNEIPSYYGVTDIKVALSIPSAVTDGSYQIYGIYKADNQSTWSVMKYKVGTPYYIEANVTSTSVIFSTPDAYPKLVLAESIKTTGNLYTGKTARVSATIQNTGSEFNSYITVKLANDSTSQYLNVDPDPINIPAGTTKTIEITGDISLYPGTCTMSILYDSNNDQDNPSMVNLTPSADNLVRVTIKDTSTTAPLLILKEKMSLDSINIINGSDVTLTTKIKNTGGYFDNSVIPFIFASTGGNSIDYFGPVTVILDTDEEKDVAFYKNINLDEGKYMLVLYYYNNTWTRFTPDSCSIINFTVSNPVSEQDTTGKLSIYSNPATDVFYVYSSSLVKSILIFDISGKQILKQEPNTTGEISITVSNLSTGVYLIKIETEEGITTKKLFKK